ncbi:Sialic acid-binding periplasmic protein SiaP precursor [Roseivivax jejudonensis]|uniref:Sialic acid-binding periplasmic protein SiaP n=1 Tax=Roseivivax jejudonensis TaxID=1529041 RepID=A0A1X7A7S6_9RHOB|nr:TRAP transporter substrate-binding protein DctP [Roseivivax jejudonensis]SLN71057.1 Sialic acid-binding periplasmic protein SiaP precursor [Roseivivax jejudonensis]
MQTILTGAILTFVLATAPATAQDFKLKVSLESPDGHVRNEAFDRFADLVSERTDGRVAIEVFGSASQYSGAEVPAALAQGSIDMGAPLYLHVGRFVPEAQFADLPMAYGADEAQIYAAVDGPFGAELHTRIEDTLGVRVLGRPFGVGHAILYTTDKKVETTADIAGLKLRVPGGAASVERFRVMGANPVSIPWPDAPQALSRGTVDGTLSTDEPIRSVAMWDSGVSHVFLDGQSYFMYVPLVSGAAWSRLPEELQIVLTDTWEEMIADTRKRANARWMEARRINQENGIEPVEASADDLLAMREKLLAIQPDLVKTLGMDPDLIDLAQEAF